MLVLNGRACEADNEAPKYQKSYDIRSLSDIGHRLSGCQTNSPCAGNVSFMQSLELGTPLSPIKDELIRRADDNPVGRYKLDDGREVAVFSLYDETFCYGASTKVVFLDGELAAVGDTGYFRLLEDYDLKIRVD